MLLYHYKGFSGGAARTLRAAVRLAGRQGCAETDTGHLLLAMLRTARGPAADFLRRKRVTETALRACVPARGEGARLPFWQKSPLAAETRKAMEFAVLGADRKSVV